MADRHVFVVDILYLSTKTLSVQNTDDSSGQGKSSSARSFSCKRTAMVATQLGSSFGVVKVFIGANLVFPIKNEQWILATSLSKRR